MTSLLLNYAPTKSITRFSSNIPLNLDFVEAELDAFITDLNTSFSNSISYLLKYESGYEKIIITSPDISTDPKIFSILNIPISATSRFKPNTPSMNFITNFLIV